MRFTEPGFDLGSCELGVATAATQIEGGNADTIWHRWAAGGGARDKTGPDLAADHQDEARHFRPHSTRRE